MTAYVSLQCSGWIAHDWQPIRPCDRVYASREPSSIHQVRGRASETGWSSQQVSEAEGRLVDRPYWIDLCPDCTQGMDGWVADAVRLADGARTPRKERTHG